MERALLLAIAIAAAGCDPGPDGTYSHDAAVDAQPPRPPTCDPPTPICGTTCGNGQRDLCYLQTMPGHCSYFGSMELCDGTVGVPTCESRGYYGGTASCRGCSGIDEGNCEACPPSSTCGTYDPLPTTTSFSLAVSGSRVALGGYYHVAVFDGLTEIARPSTSYVSSVVSVPNGWLVLTHDPAALTPITFDGIPGTSVEFPYNGGYARLWAGPPDRLLAVWREAVGEPPDAAWHIFYAVLDASGNVVVGAHDLMAEGSPGVGVTSDGTSFFVGTTGTLTRIATDGTATVVAGFPHQPNIAYDYVQLTFGGTTGWYISGPSLVLRRFDSNGSPIGGELPMTLGAQAFDFAADGNELLVFRADAKLDVLRMNSSGVFVSTTEVGGGAAYDGHFARVGSDLFVAWTREAHLHVALAPP